MRNNLPPSGSYLPAEWETDSTVLMAWPHAGTDWNYMLDEVRTCYTDLLRQIGSYRKVIILTPDANEVRQSLGPGNYRNIIPVEAPTNDTWTRDYGPLTLISPHGGAIPLDFRFNGWGLKFAANLDNCVNSFLSRKQLITAPLINCQDFVLEGGGIESDGHGSLLTTAHCQLSPNRNPWMNEAQITAFLKNIFGARQVIWLHHGYLAGDDTDSHIDTLARFAPNDTIVYTGCDDPHDEHFQELQLMKQELSEARTLDGRPFNLIELPLPSPIFDDEGQRLPATYANFLATPDAVFMPTYNQSRNDLLAKQMLQIVFEVPVIGIDCRALIRQHGSLHCATMQIPHSILAI